MDANKMLEEWFTQLHTNIIIFHLKGLKTLKLVWLKLHHFPKHLLNCDFVDSQSYGRTFHGFVRIPDAEISCFPFVRSTACLVKTRTSFEKFAKDLVNCATRCSNVTVIKLFKWRWTTIGKPEKRLTRQKFCSVNWRIMGKWMIFLQNSNGVKR